MKLKILTIILVLLVLSGCSFSKRRDNNEMNNVKFIEVEYYETNKDSIEFPIDLNWLELSQDDLSLSTKEDAFKIGNKMIDQFHAQGIYTDYSLLSILHSIKDNRWLLFYSINQRNKSTEDLIDCGGVTIMIDGNTKHIITAWIEE